MVRKHRIIKSEAVDPKTLGLLLSDATPSNRIITTIGKPAPYTILNVFESIAVCSILLTPLSEPMPG